MTDAEHPQYQQDKEALMAEFPSWTLEFDYGYWTALHSNYDASWGYVDAFYELADMLGIGARPCSPKEVWETEMRPRLLALITTEPKP